MNQTSRDILTGAREEISAKLADAEERVTQLRLQLLHAGGARERLTRELADLDAALSEAPQLPGCHDIAIGNIGVIQPTPSHTTSPRPPKPIG